MNKKGFAATGILYTILVLFILLIFSLLTMLYSRNNLLNKIQNEIKGNLAYNIYDMYDNGTAVYFNPVTGNLCDPGDAVSTTGTKTGCMKWYIFNDSIKNSYVNMILDHNTTATIAWNLNDNNQAGPDSNFVQKLESDTTGWIKTLNPRVISAEEIAKITSYPDFDILTTTEWFYFDTNNQTQMGSASVKSNYAWLFDYTYNCTSYGCNIADSQTKGYWVSSSGIGVGEFIWTVHYSGNLAGVQIFRESDVGIRPVITLDKRILKQSRYTITNMFLNGSFEDGFTGWDSNLFGKGGGTLSNSYASTGVNSVYINAVDANEKAIGYINSNITLKANHLYYFAMNGYATSYTSGLTTLGSLVNSAKHLGFDSTILNRWQRVSDIVTTYYNSTNGDIRFGQVFSDECIFQIYMDDIMLIDLTETFGSGNEPNKEWCDQNINWFEGNKNIYK